MLAATMAKAGTTKGSKPVRGTGGAAVRHEGVTAGEPKATFAEAGRKAAADAQRVLLLAELVAQDWNLSATASALAMTNSSNVLRAIRSLGLESEYEAAKAAGKIRPGARSE